MDGRAIPHDNFITDTIRLSTTQHFSSDVRDTARRHQSVRLWLFCPAATDDISSGVWRSLIGFDFAGLREKLLWACSGLRFTSRFAGRVFVFRGGC